MKSPPPSPQYALGDRSSTSRSITTSQRHHHHPHVLSSTSFYEKTPKKENRTMSQIRNGLRSITHKASSLFDDSALTSSSRHQLHHSSSNSEHSRTSSQVTLCHSPSTTPVVGLLLVASPRLIDDADDAPSSEHTTTIYIRDLTPDPRKILRCRGSSALVRSVIRANMIDCMSCKWASGYFSYVSYGVRRKQLTTLEANSLRWLICQYIILEAARRNAIQQLLRDQLTRKLTDFRIAVQCVSGMTVVKYGRKGKPHTTQLMVENADVIRWTPKLGHHLTSMLQQQKQKSISLSTVISIQSGIKSDVFRKAFKEAKGSLDPACCLSLVTPTRSLDVVTSSRQQCDWLQRSVALMVAQAHENEKKASMHVETTIMKKLGSMTVYKHGRKGKPHKTNLNVDKYGEITWKGKSGGAILLQEVQELRLGHATAVFQRLPQKANPKHCVSLVTASRTLDLELHSESERDYVVIAFRYLLNKMRDRAREAKRMKAERGVRMLQEAYQYHASRMQMQSQPVGYDLERYPGSSPPPSPMAAPYSQSPFPASSPVALERYPQSPGTTAPSPPPSPYSQGPYTVAPSSSLSSSQYQLETKFVAPQSSPKPAMVVRLPPHQFPTSTSSMRVMKQSLVPSATS